MPEIAATYTPASVEEKWYAFWLEHECFTARPERVSAAAGQWWRSYGNELWEFSPEGLMRRREASINDLAIDASQRRIFGPRPEAERGVIIPLY